jgi:hypothetical protein
MFLDVMHIHPVYLLLTLNYCFPSTHLQNARILSIRRIKPLEKVKWSMGQGQILKRIIVLLLFFAYTIGNLQIILVSSVATKAIAT